MLVVTNSIEILAYTAINLFCLPENNVFSSVTMLDTIKIKHEIGEHLGVDSQCVDARVIDEHSDSELSAWGSANAQKLHCMTSANYSSISSTKRRYAKTATG
ncbi:MAG: hypothetical protein HUJ51_01275 [Eggerthellaceae bacterium]|nr:hypothetical protein [Eggerthellaceae bacterium]